MSIKRGENYSSVKSFRRRRFRLLEDVRNCNEGYKNYLMGRPFALSKHSCNLLFALFIQAKTPNRAVENRVFHYPVLELQPLLQLASSDVNLTCGVINKFSISSFNSWVPLG